jgi:hypothetical protein
MNADSSVSADLVLVALSATRSHPPPARPRRATRAGPSPVGPVRSTPETTHFKPVQPVSVSEMPIPAVIASAMAAYATEEAVRAGINNGGSLVVAWANRNEAGFG